MFRLHPACIQATSSSCSGYIQLMFRLHPAYVEATSSLFASITATCAAPPSVMQHISKGTSYTHVHTHAGRHLRAARTHMRTQRVPQTRYSFGKSAPHATHAIRTCFLPKSSGEPDILIVSSCGSSSAYYEYRRSHRFRTC